VTTRRGRVEACDEHDARVRLRDARAQLALADLAGASTPEERKAAASCAVLAGIAAADAACCKAVGERSRSQDHRDAVALVRRVMPGGPEAARQLERLLGLKDQAQYGLGDISRQRLVGALRLGQALVAFAEDVLVR
jgi:hypothetical protein